MPLYARHVGVGRRWKPWSLSPESYGKDFQFFTQQLFSELLYPVVNKASIPDMLTIFMELIVVLQGDKA